MGTLLQTFTFERNTLRKTMEESADSVAEYIRKVNNNDPLDEKTTSNRVGALASNMGLFRRIDGKFVATEVASAFLELYSKNKIDSWRWLITRSLWLFIVPNGTNCKSNAVAKEQGITFSFFNLILKLLTYLSANAEEKRFLYFEELCKIFDNDKNWSLDGKSVFDILTLERAQGTSGFGSTRSFLSDLENSENKNSEFDIPKDNFNGLVLKAFMQTGFFDYLKHNDKTVAFAIKADLDPVLQRRLRFILDHELEWKGQNWADYLEKPKVDLPKEVVNLLEEKQSELPIFQENLKSLIHQAYADFSNVNISLDKMLLLRLSASLLSKRFLIFTGLAGSGKTKLALAFSRWITPCSERKDVFSRGAHISSKEVDYLVANSDHLAVEFWNSEKEEDAVKVTLPRQLIYEWAQYIDDHHISDNTSAREIREKVKEKSRFSSQLHSFETHLKAAAFAFLNASSKEISHKHYEIIPVGADWTSSENILGYPNGLDPSVYLTRPALDLILSATESPEIPHFLILDEMNLSHVERYFADILSAIESEEGLQLYSGIMSEPQAWRMSLAGKSIPPTLKKLPENLFIIGTVNVDETTYMFSPKVLDRANVIEFRMESVELEKYLKKSMKPEMNQLDGLGYSFAKSFVDSARVAASIPLAVKNEYDSELLLVFKVLRDHGTEFGYRTAYEMGRFIYYYSILLDSGDSSKDWFYAAFDCVIFQKVLPKMHGSRAKLASVLKKLWYVCVTDRSVAGLGYSERTQSALMAPENLGEPLLNVPENAPYPLSAAKIYRMWNLMIDNGFTSFAEA